MPHISNAFSISSLGTTKTLVTTSRFERNENLLFRQKNFQINSFTSHLPSQMRMIKEIDMEINKNECQDEVESNEERRKALQLHIEEEASNLQIPTGVIPKVPSILNTTFAYNSYLTSITNDVQPDYANASMLLLSIFYFMCNNHQKKSLKPNVSTFNMILASLVKSDDVETAEQIFETIENDNLRDSCEISIKPNTISYNTLLNSYAQNRNVNKVQLLFQHQVHNQHRRKQATPNLITLNTVLKSYARSHQSKKAKDLLDSMQSQYNIYPDVVSFTTVIDAFALAKDAVRAENVLKGMIQKQQSNTQSPHFQQPIPTIETFNAVLKAWSRSRDKNAAQRAQNLLTLMVEMSSSTSMKQKSNNIHMNNRTQIPKPNVLSFNTVLNSYSRVGDGLGAEELLEAMIDKNSPLHIPHVLPDLISYNTVMSAYARSGHMKCHEDVHRIIEKLQNDTSTIPGLENLSPDVWSYTTLINAYSRCREKNAPYKADEIFQKMKNDGITPNVSAYNALMNAWVKSGEWNPAARAHELLLEMIEDQELENPNAQTFTIVIDAYAKSREKNSAAQAHELLSYMEKLYETTRDPKVQPNVRTYTAVINAWGRSKEVGKAQRALRILNHMKKTYNDGKNDLIQPNVYTYNAILNACAYTYGDEKEKDETFRIACEVFDQLRNLKDSKSSKNNASNEKGNALYKANHVTYGTFLQVCARLMPKGESMSRRTIVEAIFKKCCKDGQVGSYVLDQLWEAAPTSLYWALLEEGGVEENMARRRSWGENDIVTIADLPSKWTKNVKERY